MWLQNCGLQLSQSIQNLERQKWRFTAKEGIQTLRDQLWWPKLWSARQLQSWGNRLLDVDCCIPPRTTELWSLYQVCNTLRKSVDLRRTDWDVDVQLNTFFPIRGRLETIEFVGLQNVARQKYLNSRSCLEELQVWFVRHFVWNLPEYFILASRVNTQLLLLRS